MWVRSPHHQSSCGSTRQLEAMPHTSLTIHSQRVTTLQHSERSCRFVLVPHTSYDLTSACIGDYCRWQLFVFVYLSMRVNSVSHTVYILHNSLFLHQICVNTQMKSLIYGILRNFACVILWSLCDFDMMMTPSNRYSFRVTGPLCGELTGHW